MVSGAERDGSKFGLRANLQSLPRPVWVLYGGIFINRFGSFVVPFLVLYCVRQGYTAAQAGLAVSCYGVGSITAAAAGGFMADRIGRKQTITISMVGSAAAMLALSQAHGLPVLVALAGLCGFFALLYRPASSALLADLVPQGRRVTAFATYRLAVNFGFAAGPATAGFLAAHSFFLLFLGDALTSTLFALIALVALPSISRVARISETSDSAISLVISDRPFLLLLLAYAGVAFIFFQAQTTLPLHVRASGLSPVVYGSLLSLNGLLVVLFELPLSSVTQRLPARPVMATGVTLLGVGFTLTAFAHSELLLAFTVLIWTLGEMIHAPVANAFVADRAPPSARGRYQGAFTLMWGIGLVTAPLLGTRLFAWNETVLWVTCGILGVLAGNLVVLSGKIATYAEDTPSRRNHSTGGMLSHSMTERAAPLQENHDGSTVESFADQESSSRSTQQPGRSNDSARTWPRRGH